MRTRGILRGFAGALAVVAALALAAPVAHAARDVMLVLDNSGSMRVNDPERLSVSAVNDFIRSQPPGTRVGVVLFADSPHLVQPLTAVENGEQRLLDSLAALDFTGQWTETAAAVERALYELRLNGRLDANKAIVLMTDGIIDTGSPERDLEKNRWLRERLIAQASEEDVRIFGIAFTERADYQLLQSIAHATGGEYFRALSAGDIAPVMGRIDRVMQRQLEREQPTRPAADTAFRQAPTTTSEAGNTPERLVFTPPVSQSAIEDVTPAEQSQSDDAADRPVNAQQADVREENGEGSWRWVLVVLALVVLGSVAIGMLWGEDVMRLLQRGVRRGREPLDHGPKAVLYDVYDPSDIKRHELGGKPVVIGRVSGSDPAMDYIVVDERTVGRWHATIERRGQSFWIRDEGSVNGTYVNDQRVTAEHPLKHGDMVRVHRHEFEFVIPELFDSDRTMISPEAKLKRPDEAAEGV